MTFYLLICTFLWEMSAKSQWMSSNQFNLSYLSYLPSSTAASSSSDLKDDAKTTLGSCESKGLSICVDLSLSSECNTAIDKANNVIELKAIDMEPNERGPQIGHSPSCRGGSSQGDLESNQLTLHADSLSCGLKGSSILETTHGSEDNSSKTLSSSDAMPGDTKNFVTKSIVETGGRVHGSMSLKQAARQFYQKFDQKNLGKRGGTQLDRETTQQKRLRLTTSKVAPAKNENDGSKLPAVNVRAKSLSSPRCRKSKLPDKSEVDQGVDVVSNLNSSEAAAPSKVQAKSQVQDITREEAAFEFQQCVSLLRKYGVLNPREYYLSQSFPNCAPHPGFVGDKFEAKLCKICRAPEDANSTIICDECHESLHVSCCLPRLNPKHFDKEDDWYCSSCRKHKRRAGRLFDSGRVYDSGDSAASFISKVKVGSAYQANVPLWTGKADCSSISGHFGMEEPLSEEAKDKEKACLLKEFELRTEAWRRQLAYNSCDGTPENWLQCHSVLVKAFKDCNGHKNNEIICGKWRRAPSSIHQFDRWECFCAIEWDPCHADCAVPQELPTEEILQRMQVRSHLQSNEILKSEET